MKDFWAYYNSQLISQTKQFSELKMKRMKNCVDKFFENFSHGFNTKLQILMDLQTKILMLDIDSTCDFDF